jgi:hypothetical protein
MFQYRVTKYDPRFRDASGVYLRDDWTMISQMGRTLEGVKLTPQLYLAVENAYVEAAIAFLTEASVETLMIRGLEKSREYCNSALKLEEGANCCMLEVADIARLILRESIWCRLEGENTYLHFGWDYYMYIGVSTECAKSIEYAKDRGLFVEQCESPYRKQPTIETFKTVY